MKFLILSALLFSCIQLMASEEVCAKKSVELNGHFGKNEAPLLKLWSETAGNFTKLNVTSKESFAKAQFILKDEEGKELKTKTLSLQKNTTSSFDFMKMMNEAVIRPNVLTVKIITTKGETFCSQDMAVVEIDGQGGVLKKL